MQTNLSCSDIHYRFCSGQQVYAMVVSSSSSSFICSHQLNKKTHTWSTREQEQDKKGTENWRLHFANKKTKKTDTLDIKTTTRLREGQVFGAEGADIRGTDVLHSWSRVQSPAQRPRNDEQRGSKLRDAARSASASAAGLHWMLAVCDERWRPVPYCDP